MSAQKINCLIAGGASFIGKKLAEALLFQNCNVIAVDDLTTSKEKNIEDLKTKPQFTFIKASINKELPKELKEEDFDAIFHLAGVEDHSLDKDINLNTLRTNALGTINLLELAKESRARFLFGSSIEVYLGVLSSLNLENYFGQTEKEQKKYSLAEAKRFGEALIWEYRKKYGINARIVRLSEIYGPGMDLKSSGSLGKFLEGAKENNALAINGDGLKKEYYTHIRDVIFGLYQAVFAKETAGKIYPLCDLKPVTELELAYLLQSLIEPKPDIIFKPPLKEIEVPELKIIDGQLQRDLNWEPKISLKEGIKETLQKMSIDLKDEVKKENLNKNTYNKKGTKIIEKKSPIKIKEQPKKIINNTKRGKKLNLLKNVKNLGAVPKILALGSALLILTVTVLPFAETGFWSYRGHRQLKETEQSLFNLNTDKAIKSSEKAKTFLQKAEQSFSHTYWLYTLFNKHEKAVQTEKVLHSAKTAAGGINNTTQSLQELSKLGSVFATEEKQTENIDFRKITLNLGQAQRKLKLAEAELVEININKIPKFLKTRLEENKQLIKTINEKVDTLQSASKVLPTMLGYEKPQTCLILLQNSNELRATGGFIGSYGELTIVEGQVDNLKIDDIYNPDGELDKKNLVVTPPPALEKHLQISNWRMRDSNWAVDFPVSAATAQQFYYEATGVETDCVIAIDLYFVEDLLKITGPLTIEEFKETINADNLFEKAEFITEAEYEPGSENKKTFLSALGSKLINSIFNLENNNIIPLVNSVENNLEEKHLLVYHSNSEINQILEEKKWNGSVVNTENSDYLFTVDSNVGATKSNYFIEKRQKLEILNIDRQGSIENTLTITYVHTGEKNVWPGGPYKNYLRVFVPEGSWLKKTIKTTENQNEKGEDITEQVIVGSEAGKTTFETFFTLNAGQSLSLKYIYRVPDYIYKPRTSEQYNIYVQKQPGTGKDSFDLDFVIPFGKEINNIPENFEKTGRILKFDTNLQKDLNIEIPLK